MRSLLFLVLAVLGGAALGATGAVLYLHTYGQSGPVVPPTTAERQARVRSFGNVAALGRLQPKGEVIDIGGPMGDRLAKLDVKEGQCVKKGAVLGSLESRGERQAEYAAYKTQLAEAKDRLAAETAYADTQIREAKSAVRAATEVDPKDVLAQEAKVQALKTALATAQTNHERLQSVGIPGAVSAQQLDQQAEQVRGLTQDLAAARALLAKAQAGEAINLERARTQVDAANAAKQRVKATIQIESLGKTVALARIRLDRTLLRAPRDGRVLAILCRPGESVGQKPILQLGDTNDMYVVAEVYETDIPLVKVGQRATITSDALSGQIGGTVERIGWSVHKNQVLQIDPTASADTRIVKVWIKLDSSKAVERLTNHQVDVKIQVTSPNPA